MNFTYHLVPQKYYDTFDPNADYVPEPFAREGFIHCTDGEEEMARTANRYYKSVPGAHYYLYIDKDRVRARVQYDDPAKTYSHIYGALNRDAIVAIRLARRQPDGTFLPPEPL